MCGRMWLAVRALLLKLKANIIWIGTAAIGAVVMLYRWKAQRAEKKAEVLKKEAEEAREQTAGYEAVIEQRKEAEAAIREVAERQKTDPPVDLTKPW